MKTPGVSRIEGPQGRGSGWMVRLTRNGKTTHKWFADGLHGGKLKAKRAAIAHHQALKAAAPPPAPLKGRKTSRNKTGKVGVMLQRKVDVRQKTVYKYENYVAFWTAPDGDPQQITFSCDKYGKRAAFKLAAIARDRQTTYRALIERHFAS